MLAIGILNSIKEQLADATHKIEITGMDMEVIRHIGQELDLHLRELLESLVDAIMGQFVA